MSRSRRFEAAPVSRTCRVTVANPSPPRRVSPPAAAAAVNLVNFAPAVAIRPAFTPSPASPTSTAVPMPDAPDFLRLSLAELARTAAGQRLPPVERWNPEHCGDSEMRIARDGAWFHQGSPIRRPELVRLFSTILRREPDGGYVLVTPVEKLTIAVEDVPFLAIEMKREGAGAAARLAFRLNTGDVVVAGPGHPLRFAPGPRPYLSVRAGLEALIARPLYYDLAEIALAAGDPPGVWSDGAFFTMDPA